MSRRGFLTLCVLVLAIEVVGLAFVTEHPIGGDFGAHYAASSLLRQGQPDLIVSEKTFVPAVERVLHRTIEGVELWPYPPMARLLVYPLSFVPIAWAFAIAMTLGLAAYLSAVLAIGGRRRDVALAALAFPAVFLTVKYGQTSLLTTALLGWGLALLSRRPAIAGLLLGLVSFKPQLAVLVPVALVAGRRWRALLAMAGTVVAFAAAGTAAFGWQSWLDFLEISRALGVLLRQGAATQPAFESVLAAVNRASGSDRLAWIVQAGVVVAVAAIVWRVWSGAARDELKISTLALATLLAAPHLCEYELALLAIPLAIAAREGLEHGWDGLERSLLLAAWLMPAFARVTFERLGIPPAPPLIVALLWLTLRRARRAATRRPAPQHTALSG